MTQTEAQASTTTALDPDQIAAKYLEERDKRLRSDGFGQYVTVDIDSEVDHDPFVTQVVQRAAVTEEVEVLVVGGGFSGLMAAAELIRSGVHDVRIIERGAGFGGTWYWNRYPGIACDVESSIYFPMLEEIGTIPSERYANGTEIRSHAEAIADRFDLESRTLFQTRVDDLTWDEGARRWIATTTRGDRITAHHVVLGTGGLISKPKLPGVPGLMDFRGKWFHTSRWDYDYTGGDSFGGLTGLAGKRVAVIGTGATSLQVVPHLAEAADHLYVVQRTPNAVDVRGNGPTDPDWFASQSPGWQKERMANFDSILAGIPQAEDMVGDQWTQIWGFPPLEIPEDGSAPDMAAYMQAIMANDLKQMERIRQRVDDLVDDPATAEALKPWFATHCKRPGFHDSYLQTFNRANVTLVDTQGRGLDRISDHAIHFDDQAYEVDCIIYATGFEAAISPGRSGGFDVRGRDGLLLEDRWAAGAANLHGIYTHGFPNLHVIGGVRGAAVSINILYVNSEQAKHVAAVIADLNSRGVDSLEITAEAESDWQDRMAEKSVYNEEATRACTPGYYNNEGDLEAASKPLFAAVYGGGPVEYIGILEEWRSKRIDETAILAFEEEVEG
ncbi:flavin-containing monooxygenase [Nocardioides sp. NPDC051685]|uniref:flavin-containing monooxygenase n=1 Tax=Nocardioides sp. NPDC051685 TaxID=3364334 RepID=UPI0037A98F34